MLHIRTSVDVLWNYWVNNIFTLFENLKSLNHWHFSQWGEEERLSRTRDFLFSNQSRICVHHFRLYFRAKSYVTCGQLSLWLTDMSFLSGQPWTGLNSITMEIEKNDIDGHLVILNHQRIPIPPSFWRLYDSRTHGVLIVKSGFISKWMVIILFYFGTFINILSSFTNWGFKKVSVVSTPFITFGILDFSPIMIILKKV